jgi:hypothetical protein
MIDQIASSCGITAFLHGSDEIGVVAQHAINCLFDELRGIFALLRSDLPDTSLGFRRKVHFHAHSLGTALSIVNGRRALRLSLVGENSEISNDTARRAGWCEPTA